MAASRSVVTLYNLMQTLGWFCVLILLTINAVVTFEQLPEKKQTFEAWVGATAASNFMATVYPLSLCQALAVFEFVFAVLGLVPSSPVTVALQIIARNIVLFPVLLVPEVQREVSILMFTVAWTLIEVVRFPWLLSKSSSGNPNRNGNRNRNGNGKAPFVLNFLRYALPLVLYPLGGCGEVWTMWNIAQTAEDVKLDVDMLGMMDDVSISFPIRSMIYYVYFPAFLPAFALLYWGAIGSCRKRACGSAKAKVA